VDLMALEVNVAFNHGEAEQDSQHTGKVALILHLFIAIISSLKITK